MAVRIGAAPRRDKGAMVHFRSAAIGTISLLLAGSLTVTAQSPSAIPAAPSPSAAPASVAPAAPVVAPIEWFEGALPATFDDTLRIGAIGTSGPTIAVLGLVIADGTYRAWASTDRTDTWTEGAIEVAPNATISSIVATDTGFLAVGETRNKKQVQTGIALWSSPDGLTWTILAPTGLDDVVAYSVDQGAGIPALAGAALGGKKPRYGTWWSPDGVTWTKQLYNVKTVPPASIARPFARNADGGLVAVWGEPVGSFIKVVRAAPDGKAWKTTDLPKKLLPKESLLWDGTRFLGVFGTEKGTVAIHTSLDGLTWTEVQASTQPYGQLVLAGGGVVALLLTESWFSDDGTTWTPLTGMTDPGALFGGGDAAVAVTSDEARQLHLWVTR